MNAQTKQQRINKNDFADALLLTHLRNSERFRTVEYQIGYIVTHKEMSVTQIAKVLNVTPKTVYNLKERFGL